MNALEVKHFEEIQKVNQRLAVVQRQFDKQQSNELGEGAEIDLFETLKEERLMRPRKTVSCLGEQTGK